MSGLAIYALAYFVSGHGDDLAVQDYVDTAYIYNEYYTGADCVRNGAGTVKDYVVEDCGKFYIVYDTENLYRERHRKMTLFVRLMSLYN